MSSSGASPRRWYLFGGMLLAPLAVLGSLLFGFDPVEHEARKPLVHRLDDFVGSRACRSCHPDQHASWHRTYHRTMTQRAEPGTIVGAFDGARVGYMGQSARPFRDGERFLIELPRDEPGAAGRVAEVALAVGSRRYQQYFERVERSGGGFVFERLPILWHIAERRWLHVNTIFLRPDDANWDAHRSRWNDNCIFCHNTGPKPGEIDLPGFHDTRQFDSRVGELGISCETCHGPGAAHVAAYRDPLRRYGAYLRDADEAAIVNPERLDPERAVSLCGQCHGQRMPHDDAHLVEWLTDGPTFRSGERLVDHARPVRRDTPSPVEGNPELFRLRFWADGTPRLTAYEYQGVTMSPCFAAGALTCESCHEMHGGDPRGMIEPALRGDRACLQCHAEIAEDVRRHTGHDPQRSGAACLECHMPRAVYGILQIHRSHRIENPDPRRDGEAGRPHACTTCHLDRSLLWSAEKMAEIWGEGYAPPASRADDAPVDLPDSVASMLAGDAVQRAVYAWAAGRADAPLEPRDKAVLRAALTVTLADAYPSVRSLARRSLIALEREHSLGMQELLQGWDHTDAAGRTEFARIVFDELRRRAPERLTRPDEGLLRSDFAPDMEAITRLLARQDQRVISIGE